MSDWRSAPPQVEAVAFPIEVAATQRPVPDVLPCGVEHFPPPKGWPLKRKPPRCGRPKGHDGEHQQIRRSDFYVEARWADAPPAEAVGGGESVA